MIKKTVNGKVHNIDKMTILVWIAFVVSVIVRFSIANFFPKRIAIYPDELIYYKVAESIAKGRGIQIYNTDCAFQNILYSIAIVPAFLFKNTRKTISAIAFINSILVSVGVFPIHLLAKDLLKKMYHRVLLIVIYFVYAAMTYSMTFVAENLYLPLCLVEIYFIYKGINGLKYNVAWKNTVMYVGIGGGFTLIYYCKAVGLSMLVAYCAYEVIQYICIIKRNKMVISTEIVDLFRKDIIIFSGMIVTFLLIKCFVFGMASGPYSIVGSGITTLEDRFLRNLFYGIAYYTFATMMYSTFVAPVVLLLFSSELFDREKKLFLYVILAIGATAFTVSEQISSYELTNGWEVPLVHIRYIIWCPFVIILLMLCVLQRDMKITETNFAWKIKLLIAILISFLITYEGNDFNYLDHPMWLTYFIKSKSSNEMLLFMLLISVLSIMSVILICNNKKKVFLNLFLVINIFVQIFDNAYAINTYKGGYSASINDYEDAQLLCNFAEKHGEDTILRIENFSGLAESILDMYMDEGNVIVSSYDCLQSCKAENGYYDLSQSKIPVIYSYLNDYVGENIKYVMAENNVVVTEDENVVLVPEACTQYYNTYEIIDITQKVCITRIE